MLQDLDLCLFLSGLSLSVSVILWKVLCFPSLNLKRDSIKIIGWPCYMYSREINHKILLFLALPNGRGVKITTTYQSSMNLKCGINGTEVDVVMEEESTTVQHSSQNLSLSEFINSGQCSKTGFYPVQVLTSNLICLIFCHIWLFMLQIKYLCFIEVSFKDFWSI